MQDFYKFKEISDLIHRGQVEEANLLLASIQAKYIYVCDQNNFLRTQLQQLEETLFFAKNLYFDEICYWLNTGGIKQGPFCKQCYEQDGALIRLEPHNSLWICPTCQTVHQRKHTPLAKPAPQLAKVFSITGR